MHETRNDSCPEINNKKKSHLSVEQGDVADELEEHAEPLSGRSKHRDERQDQ